MKTTKKINKIISIGHYPYDLMISFNETDDSFNKKMKYFGIESENYNEEIFNLAKSKNKRGRYSLFLKDKQSVIRLNFIPNIRDPEEMGLLQHEIFHVVHFFMEEINTPLVNKTSEPYAYLIQYLTKEIYKLLY